VVRALISTNLAVPMVTFVGTFNVFWKAALVGQRAKLPINILT